MRIMRLRCNIRGLAQSGVGVAAPPPPPGKRRRRPAVPHSLALRRRRPDADATGEYVSFVTRRATLHPPVRRARRVSAAPR